MTRDEDYVEGESDWHDQDLLTVDLAVERLQEEIDAVEAQIAELEQRGDADELAAARSRRSALVDSRDRIRGDL